MRHVERDLERIKKLILTMGGLVEKSLLHATRALVELDRREANLARDADAEIDRMQLEIDDDVLKLLALHQPVAGDLRFCTAVMKICNDLERIGDLAENLAERALFVIQRPALNEPLEIDAMVECARGMLRDSLDALVNKDSELARDVCKRDDLVDAANSKHFDVLQERMKHDPDSVEAAVAWLSASRNIERIADLATNIAEDVVFLVDAIDIRHPGLAGS